MESFINDLDLGQGTSLEFASRYRIELKRGLADAEKCTTKEHVSLPLPESEEPSKLGVAHEIYFEV
jgi:hypothetical protein